MYSVRSVTETLEGCVDLVLKIKQELTEIDGRLGDGDLGVSMEKGALALRKSMREYCGENIGPLLTEGGMAFNATAPSTMGTLVSAGLMALGRRWKERATLTAEDIVTVPRLLAETMAKQGKACPGDKTVLDALYPCAGALEAAFAETGDLSLALKSAAKAAREGAEATKDMRAGAGRARWLGERTAGVADGGAVLCALLAEHCAGAQY